MICERSEHCNSKSKIHNSKLALRAFRALRERPQGIVQLALDTFLVAQVLGRTAAAAAGAVGGGDAREVDVGDIDGIGLAVVTALEDMAGHHLEEALAVVQGG